MNELSHSHLPSLYINGLEPLSHVKAFIGLPSQRPMGHRCKRIARPRPVEILRHGHHEKVRFRIN